MSAGGVGGRGGGGTGEPAEPAAAAPGAPTPDERDRYQAQRTVQLTPGGKPGATPLAAPPLALAGKAPAGTDQASTQAGDEDPAPPPAKPAKPLEASTLATRPATGGAGGAPGLSARDQALANYDELLKRLPPAERQKLREYLRRLRDIR